MTAPAPPPEALDEIAPVGQVYVCTACGKRSRDRMGDHRISDGWDVSCFMHAVLCYEDSIVLDGGRVVAAKAVTP